MAIGPSTTQTPYLVASAPRVAFTSILSAGDIAGSKPGGAARPFVGVPDGIGAFGNGDGTATVLVNHEIGAASGVVREHGSAGAFIDRFVIDTRTLQIVAASDLVKTVFQDNDGGGSYVDATTAFAALCSGDLPAVAAFFNAATGKGTTERIYMAGEEAGTLGRAFAFVVTGADAGKAFELPAAGNMSFENLLANPASGDNTIVMETDDISPRGQVYLYLGTKQNTGSTIERAGLTNGLLYGVTVTGVVDETDATFLPGDSASFALQLVSGARSATGAQIQTSSEALGITEFQRPEDGAWDPAHPNWFYFATTATLAGNSRLWRLEFADLNDPAAGGTIRMMLNGSEGHRMLDNLTVTADGKVIVLEDTGNSALLDRVLQYDPVTDTLTVLGVHDPARFAAPTPPFTQDEEASGIIDVTSIFGNANAKAFLLDTQAHYGIAGEVVQGGQLQIMYQLSAANLPSNFNGDGYSDILWQNDNGTVGIWLMEGFGRIADSGVGFNPGPTWKVKGRGDFNGDGKADILWQNDDGTAGIWLLDGFARLAGANVGFNPGPTWKVKDAGDFNGDGRSDILWQNDDGSVGIWLMNGLGTIADSGVGPSVGPTWHVKASGDFNGDGKADILWQNDNGAAAIWLMDGLTRLAGANVGFNPGPTWKVKDAGDFNGDGRADILWQNDNGTIGIWLMHGFNVIADGGVAPNVGSTWQVKTSGDYNGDGKSDILWQNDDGSPAIWLMDGLARLAGANVGFNPGVTWHVIPQDDLV